MFIPAPSGKRRASGAVDEREAGQRDLAYIHGNAEGAATLPKSSGNRAHTATSLFLGLSLMLLYCSVLEENIISSFVSVITITGAGFVTQDLLQVKKIKQNQTEAAA